MKQKSFIEQEWWEEHWKDMPEYISEDLSSFKAILVHFENRQDMIDFSNLINQKITTKTQSIWYPKAKKRSFKNKVYVTKGYKNAP